MFYERLTLENISTALIQRLTYYKWLKKKIKQNAFNLSIIIKVICFPLVHFTVNMT